MAKKPAQQENAQAESADDYFVAVQHPKELRRTILESSRDVIYAMQDFQKLVLVRQKKLELYAQFREQMKEISVLLGRLSKYFPENKVISYKKKEQPKQVQQQVQAKPVVSEPKPLVKPKSEIEQLNDLLSGIEDKLRRMS